MEINEYVRTKDGKIGKYIQPELGKPNITNGISFNEGANYGKHSKDIIDLIEVGDYVNGRKVIFTKNNFPKGYCKNNKNDFIFTDYNDEYGEWFGFKSDEIETVLTHEQFEANAYKIEKEV